MVIKRTMSLWLSTRGRSATHSTTANVWKHFFFFLHGGGAYWHLVGRGHGSCCTSYNDEESPLTINDLFQTDKSAEVKNLSSMVESKEVV